jgi:CubicO group peptidase (beta-lactamase class C family)
MRGLPGAFEVSRGGRVVAEGAGGHADRSTGVPCTSTTRFQAASVSKHIVATTLMLLTDRGEVSPEDRVGRWWPAAPPAWRTMTVGHVLEHSAGLPHWPDLPGLDFSCPPTADEILGRAATVALSSPPGARWSYSGVGYLLAAAIVEAVTGQSYGAFVTDNVFLPLGMTATTSGITPDDGVATGHRDGRPEPLIAGLTALPGTGDVWTTVGDLVRYAEALSDGTLLSERSWRLMSQPHMLIDDPSHPEAPVSVTAYGYGTYIGTLAGEPARFHHGDNPGFRSLLAWVPEAEVTLAVLSNEESVTVEDMARRFARTIHR